MLSRTSGFSAYGALMGHFGATRPHKIQHNSTQHRCGYPLIFPRFLPIECLYTPVTRAIFRRFGTEGHSVRVLMRKLSSEIRSVDSGKHRGTQNSRW